jgi:hypothetical protein
VSLVSSHGGRSGCAYLVEVASLPPELRAKLPKPAEATPGLILPGTGGLGWRLEVVRRVRETPPGTPERAAAVARLAREATWPHGPRRGRPVGERTVRRWVAEYEGGGMGAVADRRRGRSGAEPAAVSRAFDAFAAPHGVPPDGLARIAAALDRYCESLWAKLPRANAAHIARCAPAKLAELLRGGPAAGPTKRR